MHNVLAGLDQNYPKFRLCLKIYHKVQDKNHPNLNINTYIHASNESYWQASYLQAIDVETVKALTAEYKASKVNWRSNENQNENHTIMHFKQSYTMIKIK